MQGYNLIIQRPDIVIPEAAQLAGYWPSLTSAYAKTDSRNSVHMF